MRYQVAVADRSVSVDATSEGRLLIDGRVRAYDAREVAEGTWSVVLDGRSYEIVLRDGRAEVDGMEVAVSLTDERTLAARQDRTLAAGGRHEVRAPMPGLLKSVHVAAGDIVERDGAVATLEAMKMENELRAPSRSRVQRLAAAPGSKVESGSLIAVLIDEPA